MGVCDVPVISSVCDAVGEGAASLVAAPFDWLAQAMGAAAGWLFEAVWSVFDTTTLVDVTKPGYVAVYNLLFGIAVFVMLIFFCLQLITGLIRRDPTALTRAALGLAKSVLGSFVVITLTALLLEVVDQLCIGIVQAAGETTESMGDKIALLAAGLVGINIAAPGVGAIITIFMAGLAITAAAIVWLSLLVRKALLLVAVVFAPLAFSGASWDASRGWIGKWAMFVVALICSKLVLVVMFLVAITQVSAPIDADLASVSDPIAGIVLMAMAAFAPYLTYKFIAFVGFDMYHAIGSEQDAKSALNRPIPVPSKPQGGADPKKVLDGTAVAAATRAEAPVEREQRATAAEDPGTDTRRERRRRGRRWRCRSRRRRSSRSRSRGRGRGDRSERRQGCRHRRTEGRDGAGSPGRARRRRCRADTATARNTSGGTAVEPRAAPAERRPVTAAAEAAPAARATPTEGVDDEQHEQRPADRGRAGAGEVLPPHPPRCPPRPVADPAHHPRHRRSHAHRRVLRRRRDAAGLHRPGLGTRRRTDLDTHRGPTDRGMAAHRLLVAVAHHRRATAVPAQDRRAAPRRHARAAR